MKHFFIINPISGTHDATEELTELIERIFKDKKEEYEIYVTKDYRDSYKIASEKSKDLTEDTIFYACGGDGTSFDVINGIAGREHAYFSVIPTGSCNDFLKTFPEYSFKAFDEVINGELRDIDLCKANDYYYLNELNIGYDALVNDDCNKSPIKAKNVKKAYNRAIIKNLIHFKTHKMMVKIEDGEEFEAKALLVVAANGQYYGSKYRCAPNASPFDGKFDFMIVKKITRIKFISMIKSYEKGLHLVKESFKKIIRFEQTTKVTLTADENLVVCLDGEIFYWPKVDIQVIPQAIKMLFPRKK